MGFISITGFSFILISISLIIFINFAILFNIDLFCDIFLTKKSYNKLLDYFKDKENR